MVRTSDFLDGFAARLTGKGWDCNPHNRTNGDFDADRRRAWRYGWGEADEWPDAPELRRECPDCQATGARLLPGATIRKRAGADSTEPCGTCGGTGLLRPDTTDADRAAEFMRTADMARD